MMSPRIEIVRRALEALNAGDVEAFVTVCDADFRLDMADRVLNPSVYEGHDGIRAFYADVVDIWESFTWEPIEMHELDNMLKPLIRLGEVACCGTCMDARGIDEKQLVEGARRSSLEELTDSTLWADRILCF